VSRCVYKFILFRKSFSIGYSLFLNLKEAAFRSKGVYDKPSDITVSLGQWNGGSADTTIPSTQRRFIGEWTFSQMMTQEDFAMDIHRWEDGENEDEALNSSVESGEV